MEASEIINKASGQGKKKNKIRLRHLLYGLKPRKHGLWITSCPGCGTMLVDIRVWWVPCGPGPGARRPPALGALACGVEEHLPPHHAQPPRGRQLLRAPPGGEPALQARGPGGGRAGEAAAAAVQRVDAAARGARGRAQALWGPGLCGAPARPRHAHHQHDCCLWELRLQIQGSRCTWHPTARCPRGTPAGQLAEWPLTPWAPPPARSHSSQSQKPLWVPQPATGGSSSSEADSPITPFVITDTGTTTSSFSYQGKSSSSSRLCQRPHDVSACTHALFSVVALERGGGGGEGKKGRNCAEFPAVCSCFR